MKVRFKRGNEVLFEEDQDEPLNRFALYRLDDGRIERFELGIEYVPPPPKPAMPWDQEMTTTTDPIETRLAYFSKGAS